MALLLRLLLPVVLLWALLTIVRSLRSRWLRPATGVVFGQLRPGPHSRNGIRAAMPWLSAGRAATEQRLAEVLAGLPGSRMLSRSGDYWHVCLAGGVFRFIDDVEVLFKDIGQTVDIRIERRGTWRDFGAGRRWLTMLRSALQEDPA